MIHTHFKHKYSVLNHKRHTEMHTFYTLHSDKRWDWGALSFIGWHVHKEPSIILGFFSLFLYWAEGYYFLHCSALVKGLSLEAEGVPIRLLRLSAAVIITPLMYRDERWNLIVMPHNIMYYHCITWQYQWLIILVGHISAVWRSKLHLKVLKS